ncbi:glycosyl hydrolase 115 family protein [Thalassobellus suaedae]|uniref:Glycosyl hydrolase 115 family protein n=1 Tax=Thalassobellus suaedae TaxID=3074124 RepID=A0ABY9Y381_9FLAO|nr:glycosyl hydrolase 115 family protein [Flavobacteriaceae bacterium HL-DH10]
MKYFCLILSSTIVLLLIGCNSAISYKNDTSNVFEIYNNNTKAIILYEKGKALDSITAHLLSEDIYKVTNQRLNVVNNINAANGNTIVIGSMDSPLINVFLKDETLKEGFKDQWESYLYKTISNPTKKIKKAFIIAGTNPRGTAYGIFNISKKIGVNPWYWWADVPVTQSEELILEQPDFYSNAPSVAYRGIFLNDEDWGLQPWADKTFEPETGDIGPKTYSKIFELLLRLNANTIWPAMHPSTKAFFYYHDNAKMAEVYNIIIGTSHAEPMLRNNVDEWSEDTYGHFNYKTNKDNVYKYWEDRVKEAKDINAIYTIGMRGVHDSGMEGVKSNDEAVALLDGIIKDQRDMLKKHINLDVTQVPQAFTVYKEVLDLYKAGLKVSDDITLVWTDDNYGYIRALSNADEQKRSGGSGVYYHASYWGRPHDYLWLSTTNPYLIHEEMMKAYNLNNRKIWIINVGDIKPAEYNTQLFLDMAYDASKFQNPEYIATHQQEFYSEIFGSELGNSISKIREDYFQLAFERKPEFMGWSQTEPTTPIANTAYNTLANGDEIQKRIDAYDAIEKQVQVIETQLSGNLKSAFTQLVGYPVKASSHMNKKFLFRDKAMIYAKQGRKSASNYAKLSHQAYNEIEALTKKYNMLSNRKWEGMMDMKPRKLPVYDDPEIILSKTNTKEAIGISVEDTLTTSEGALQIPTFYVNDIKSYFIDIYLKHTDHGSWSFNDFPKWVKLSKTSGNLNVSNIDEERVFISIDWNAWKKAGEQTSKTFKIETNSEEKNIQINISKSYNSIPETSFIEKNGMAVMYANHFSKKNDIDTLKWKEIRGLGHSKSVMQSNLLKVSPILNQENAPFLEYEMYTETISETANLTLVAIPTHPLTTDSELRIAVQWNNEPIQLINFKTEGRSNTWKQNVLSNKALKQIQVPIKSTGKQKLRIYMFDPGVLLDYFVLNTRNQTQIPYKLMPETRLNSLK